MSASTVYDGVKANGAGGSLFRYKKFWVAQRVPQRPGYLEKIKVRSAAWSCKGGANALQSNGGTVVPLEKHADVLVADHLRRDAPQGSVSYEYIDACLKNGELVDEEKYPAGRPQRVARPVGSSEPAKTTRTPFTAEDDRILTQWVLEAERKNGSIRGNKIYEELAANVGAVPHSVAEPWLIELRRTLDTRSSLGETAGSNSFRICQGLPSITIPSRPPGRPRTHLSGKVLGGGPQHHNQRGQKRNRKPSLLLRRRGSGLPKKTTGCSRSTSKRRKPLGGRLGA